MILIIPIIFLIMVCILSSIIKHKKIERFYYLTSEELEKTTTDLLNARKENADAIKKKEELELEFSNVKNELKKIEDDIAQYTRESNPEDIDLTSDDKIRLNTAQTKLTECINKEPSLKEDWRAAKDKEKEIDDIIAMITSEYNTVQATIKYYRDSMENFNKAIQELAKKEKKNIC